MLSGSAIMRASLLLVVTGLLAGLVQALLPRGTVAPSAASPSAPAPVRAESRATPSPVAPQRTAPATEVRRAERPVAPAEPAGPPPAPGPVAAAEPIPMALPAAASIEPAEPVRVAARTSPSAAPVAVPSSAPAEEAPRGLVDLNSAAVGDLNRLRGGGSIGRAIVQRRPYASVDELLSKRVLSRATYDRIKDQVTVQ